MPGMLQLTLINSFDPALIDRLFFHTLPEEGQKITESLAGRKQADEDPGPLYSLLYGGGRQLDDTLLYPRYLDIGPHEQRQFVSQPGDPMTWTKFTRQFKNVLRVCSYETDVLTEYI